MQPLRLETYAGIGERDPVIFSGGNPDVSAPSRSRLRLADYPYQTFRLRS